MTLIIITHKKYYASHCFQTTANYELHHPDTITVAMYVHIGTYVGINYIMYIHIHCTKDIIKSKHVVD